MYTRTASMLILCDNFAFVHPCSAPLPVDWMQMVFYAWSLWYFWIPAVPDSTSAPVPATAPAAAAAPTATSTVPFPKLAFTCWRCLCPRPRSHDQLSTSDIPLTTVDDDHSPKYFYHALLFFMLDFYHDHDRCESYAYGMHVESSRIL